MPDEDDYLAEDEESSEPKGEGFAAARAKLERRCEAASIPLGENESLFKKGEKYLRVDLPAGREKRGLLLWNAEDIRALLSVPFEKYVFLIPYEALCSYEQGSIEALISSLGRTPLSTRSLFFGKGREGDVEDEEIVFSLPSPDARFSVSLSPTPTHLKILMPRSSRSKLMLRINGLHVQRHIDAIDILRRVSDSLFFQIDLSKGIALTLVRERRYPFLGGRRLAAKPLEDLQFPTQEYSEVPMSLYWYARSAFGMPLLQFLAYYQTIEFYLLRYYQAEAYRKVRRILKDPAFRSDRDVDIARVLSSLTAGRDTMGDEKSMIRATFQECVDPDELRAFLLSDDHKKKFFSSKTKWLTCGKLPLANPVADLRNDVADRIYEIRCKIVHTKADTRDGEIKLLLPFSKEADQLYHDINLVQYLAQQVLITASTSLQM